MEIHKLCYVIGLAIAIIIVTLGLAAGIIISISYLLKQIAEAILGCSELNSYLLSSLLLVTSSLLLPSSET